MASTRFPTSALSSTMPSYWCADARCRVRWEKGRAVEWWILGVVHFRAILG